MEDLRQIISENITLLRRAAGMTQASLAEQLNYSDKAVSKWERGESLPDIMVLKQLAELFGVTVDYLLAREHSSGGQSTALTELKRKRVNRGLIITMSLISVWMVALAVFLAFEFLDIRPFWSWLSFIYPLPVCCVVWLVLNTVWFRGKWNSILISALIWTLLCTLHLTLLQADVNLALIYVVGAPAQVIVILATRMKVSTRQSEDDPLLSLEEALEREAE